MMTKTTQSSRILAGNCVHVSAISVFMDTELKGAWK